MVEAGPAPPEGTRRTFWDRFRQRLSNGRWPIAAVAAVVLLLLAGGGTSVAGAVVILATIAVLVAVFPVEGPAHRPTIPAGPPTGWPDTGIKLFAEALPDPCFILDPRGIVRYANAAATAAFPVRTGDPLMFRLRVPELTAALDRVAKGGEAERVEFSQRVPTERWFTAWLAKIAPRSGDEFVVLVVDDQSERRRLDRIRVDFVANASHELRTPLASLTGFIETLQGSARNDAEARERFLTIMHDQAMRMTRLIDDLLSLSRIELKQHMRPSDQVDLVAVLKHLGDSLEPLARELDVAVEFEKPQAPVNVAGDRDELIQVFENLVENAIKYGQSGKRVVITVEPAGEASGPSVAVRDFGPGIAEEHVPRLTERFYRIDEDASRRHRGTGLGLAIVKHILARHEAELTIESRVGEGALFRVTFPQGHPRPGVDGDNYYQ